MKKLIFTFLLLSISTVNFYAQQGWFWQNPLPQGNYLSSVYISGNTAYTIGDLGTFFKTTNLGVNWTVQNQIPFFQLFSSKFFDLNNIYLVTDNSYLVKTSNGGLNWETYPILQGFNPKVNFVNLQTGFSMISSHITNIIGEWTLFKTTNSGINWIVNKIDSSAYIWNFHFPSVQTGYVVGRTNAPFTFAKVFKTSNSGVSWDSIYTGIRSEARNVYFINDNTGFLSTWSPGFRLFRTTNGAQSWDSVYSMVNSPSFFYFYNANTGFAFNSNETIKTTNFGVNWTSVNIPTNNFCFDENSNGFSVGASGVIHKTTNNGLNWNNYTTSVYNGFIGKVKALNENVAFIACDNSTILKTTNGGSNWLTITDHTMDFYNDIHFFNANTGIAAGQSYVTGSRIRKTTNGGLNWYQVVGPITDQITDINFPNDSVGYSVTKVGYFSRSIDKGESWSQPVFWTSFASGGLKFINENTGFWVGSSNVTNYAQIRKTINGGLNWSETNFDSIDALSDVDFLNSTTGFAAGFYISYSGPYYNAVILRTTNAGNNWERFNLPGSKIFEVKVADSDTVYASCSYGQVLKSTNSGQTWEIYQTCYAGYIYSIDFINSNTGYGVSGGGVIIKTTNGGGSPIGIEPISNNIPNKYKLYQNYPNPFNPVTKIKFSIPVNSQLDPVNIYIYDVTGREIINYSYGNLKAGIYSIDFDGTDLASGVYFYQLVTGNFSQTRKMVFIK